MPNGAAVGHEQDEKDGIESIKIPNRIGLLMNASISLGRGRDILATNIASMPLSSPSEGSINVTRPSPF